ncbi:MAG: hypothetical protein IPL91_06460 [Hyphomicrobium sp.]|nr:hypothetical protein [Hyphomicrobium sp.]
MRRPSKKTLGTGVLGAKIMVVAVAATITGGCDEYLDRRDTVSRGAGESVAFNKATQTIDRWPPVARRDRWNSDGERARLAVDHYRTGKTTEPAAVGSGVTTSVDGAAQDAK